MFVTESSDRPLAAYCEFARRRDGMIHAMDGGLWLHRHMWKGRPMAHLVSTDKLRLLGFGAHWLAPWFARPKAWQVLDGLIGVTMFVLSALLVRHALLGV